MRVAVDKLAAFSIRETPWNPKQEFRPLPDGCEELFLRTSSLPDIENKILRGGAHAEALAPQVLCDRVHAALKAALGQYEQCQTAALPTPSDASSSRARYQASPA